MFAFKPIPYAGQLFYAYEINCEGDVRETATHKWIAQEFPCSYHLVSPISEGCICVETIEDLLNKTFPDTVEKNRECAAGIRQRLQSLMLQAEIPKGKQNLNPDTPEFDIFKAIPGFTQYGVSREGILVNFKSHKQQDKPKYKLYLGTGHGTAFKIFAREELLALVYPPL